MKRFLIILCTLLVFLSLSLTVTHAADFVADWNSWAYTPGDLGGGVSVGGEDITLTISGATDSIASLDGGAIKTPIVTPFYTALSQDSLATSIQLSQFVDSVQRPDGTWIHTSKQLIFALDFGTPTLGVSNLSFSLLDVDGHENSRFKRQEVYTITGYLGAQQVTPVISSRAEPGVHRILGNQIEGLKIVRPNLLPLLGEGTLSPVNGVADISFAQAVDRVVIVLTVNVDDSVTIEDSTPGFGIGAFSFAARELTDISATKRWDNVSMYQPGMPPAPTSPPDVWLKLTRKSSAEPLADVPGSLITLTAGDYDASNEASHIWQGLPSEDPHGNLYTYSVVETNETGSGAASPTNYMVRTQKDVANPNHTVLTNIYLPIQNGNRSTLPCQLSWYADATIDNSIQDYSNNYFGHKVSCTLFGEESGYFAMHHWGGSKVGESVYWRIPLATNHDIVNGRLVIPFDDPDFVPFVPATDPVSFYTEQWRFNLITFHTMTPDPVSSYTLLTDPNSPITNPAPTDRPSYTYNWDEEHTRVVSLTMDIPYMPAMSAYMIQFSGKIVNAATADNPHVNFYLGATFTADYNCVVADKVWIGGEPADPTDVIFELYANGAAVPDSKTPPTLITLADNSQVLRAVWTQLAFNDAQGKPIDYSVEEIAVADGFELIHTQWEIEAVAEGEQEHIKHYTFANMLTKDITGIKRWANDSQTQRNPIYLMVAERVEDSNGQYQLVVPTNAVDKTPLYGAVAVDLSQSEFSHTFTGLPAMKPDGTPIEYTVVEARNATGALQGTVYDYGFGAPLGYLRSTERLANGTIVITNTLLPAYEPVKDGDNSQPCVIDWYASNVRDRFSTVEPSRDKVSAAYLAFADNHSIKPSEGFMVLQSWPEDEWRSFFWRTIMGTNNELQNGVMTFDLSGLRALGMVPVKAPNGRYLWYDTTVKDQAWLDRGAGLDAAYNKRYTVIDMSSVTETLSADGNTLTVSIPHMDAKSVILFSIKTSLDPTLTPVQDYYLKPLDGQSLDGTRYALGVRFQAETRCVHVEKTWLGIPAGSEQAVVQLTINNKPLLDTAREELAKHLGTSFADNAPDYTQAYRALRDWVNAVDVVVPGFFSAMLKNPGTPLKESLWVDWSVNPPVYHNYSYTFDQAQLDLTVGLLEAFYQASLTPANNTYTFGQLPWLTPEAYSVVETQLPDGWMQQGEVTRDMNEWRVLLAVTNRQFVDITATKTWSGGPASDHTAVPLVLTRQVEGGTAEVVTSPAYAVSGSAPAFTYTWPALPTTDDTGKANTYTVQEAGAANGSMVVNSNTYLVTQEANHITNTFDPPAPASYSIQAGKQLTGAVLARDQFAFQLFSSPDGVVLQEVTNAADGTIHFQELLFTGTGRYVFELKEKTGTEAGMVYDASVYTLVIEITLGNNNALVATLSSLTRDGAALDPATGIVFTNLYQAPTPTPTPVPTVTPTPRPTRPPTPSYPELRVPLMAKKTLQGGVLKANEFSFELRDAAGNILATVQNQADGSIIFPDRTFSKEVSKYLYTIREVKGEGSGTTYDTTVYTVKVTTKAVAGVLQATVDIEKNGTPAAGTMVFYNQRDLPKTGDRAMQAITLLLSLSVVASAGAFIAKKRMKRTDEAKKQI